MYQYKVNPRFCVQTGTKKEDLTFDEVKGNDEQLEKFLNESVLEGWDIFALSPVFIVRRQRA